MKLRWTAPALGDLEAIGDFVAEDSPQAAQQVVTQIFARVDGLVDQPHMGRRGRVEGTREFVVTGTSYIVAYRISDAGIEILAVVHSAMRWPDRFPSR